MSLRLRLLSAYLRRVEKPRLARLTDPRRERRAFERAARLFRTPPEALFLSDTLGGVPGQWASAVRAPRGLILYIHGGAGMVGSSHTHRALAARLSRLTGARVFLPDYRLAPEHPFPAAQEDVRRVWDALAARGYNAQQIVLGGDSSGGGLVFSLLSDLLEAQVRPCAAFAFAPWLDMTFSGQSFVKNADRDALLPTAQAARVLKDVLQGHDPADPRASPLFAEYPRCPPVFLQASATEILLDDTRRLAARLRDEGADVSEDIWGDAPHVWAIFQGWVPEADAAVARAARFVRQELTAATAGAMNVKKFRNA